MTKRPNDETTAPEEWGFEPQDAQTERAERADVLRRLARRLYYSHIPTPTLAALLDVEAAPLWAFEELPAMAEAKQAQRDRKREGETPLTFDMLDAVIDQLHEATGKPPKPGEVCAELSERRGTEAESERGAVSRLLNGDEPRGIWDSEFEMHEGIGGDSITLSEYIRRRTCPEEWAREIFGPEQEENK